MRELDAAINELERFDPRRAQVVGLRYFIGLSVSEIARTLTTSERAIQREWQLAQARLRDRLDT